MTQLLTYEDAALQWKVSTRTIRRYIARKKIRVIQLSGNTKRIRQADLDRAADKLTTHSIL
jgi:excisionase family DNA binding protein